MPNTFDPDGKPQKEKNPFAYIGQRAQLEADKATETAQAEPKPPPEPPKPAKKPGFFGKIFGKDK